MKKWSRGGNLGESHFVECQMMATLAKRNATVIGNEEVSPCLIVRILEVN